MILCVKQWMVIALYLIVPKQSLSTMLIVQLLNVKNMQRVLTLVIVQVYVPLQMGVLFTKTHQILSSI